MFKLYFCCIISAMKRIFNIIIIIFTLAISLLLEPNALQTQPLDSTGYIQNIKNETVVLVANNVLGGEITSYQEKSDQNFSSSTPLALNYQVNQDLLNKNIAQSNGCFIHNLSTSKQKVHPIRAP